MAKNEILFIGDSITECYDFKRFFPHLNIINEGISGNTTVDILKRLNEMFKSYNPVKVFILIGTNDLELIPLTSEEIIINIKKIVTLIKKNFKGVPIYLQSVYPVFYEIKPFSVGKRKNEDIIKINEGIKKIEGITYINLYDDLLGSNNKLNKEFTYDGIHMSEKGYEFITKKLNKYL